VSHRQPRPSESRLLRACARAACDSADWKKKRCVPGRRFQRGDLVIRTLGSPSSSPPKTLYDLGEPVGVRICCISRLQVVRHQFGRHRAPGESRTSAQPPSRSLARGLSLERASCCGRHLRPCRASHLALERLQLFIR
jgi:hypothetical protein